MGNDTDDFEYDPSWPPERSTKGRKAYSITDDLHIINYLLKTKDVTHLGGNEVWKRMQRSRKHNPKGFTYQSLRERWRKTIAPSIERYGIGDQKMEFLLCKPPGYFALKRAHKTSGLQSFETDDDSEKRKRKERPTPQDDDSDDRLVIDTDDDDDEDTGTSLSTGNSNEIQDNASAGAANRATTKWSRRHKSRTTTAETTNPPAEAAATDTTITTTPEKSTLETKTRRRLLYSDSRAASPVVKASIIDADALPSPRRVLRLTNTQAAKLRKRAGSQPANEPQASELELATRERPETRTVSSQRILRETVVDTEPMCSTPRSPRRRHKVEVQEQPSERHSSDAPGDHSALDDSRLQMKPMIDELKGDTASTELVVRMSPLEREEADRALAAANSENEVVEPREHLTSQDTVKKSPRTIVLKSRRPKRGRSESGPDDQNEAARPLMSLHCDRVDDESVLNVSVVTRCKVRLPQELPTWPKALFSLRSSVKCVLENHTTEAVLENHMTEALKPHSNCPGLTEYLEMWTQLRELIRRMASADSNHTLRKWHESQVDSRVFELLLMPMCEPDGIARGVDPLMQRADCTGISSFLTTPDWKKLIDALHVLRSVVLSFSLA